MQFVKKVAVDLVIEKRYICDMRSLVKEAVLFNTCSLLYIRLHGSSCQGIAVVFWCAGGTDWY